MWVESCLPKIHVKVLPPRISDCDLIWNKVVADVASYDEVILEQSGPIIQYNWCPYKRRKSRYGDRYT